MIYMKKVTIILEKNITFFNTFVEKQEQKQLYRVHSHSTLN
jgi:hypothetical protein